MKRIFISLFMIVVLASCQEHIVVPEAVVDDVMRFSFIAPGVQTKVSAGEFETADRIGLYVTDYADDVTSSPLQVSGNRANNFPVVYDGTSWASEKTVYWGKGKSDVYAYYPFFESVTDINSQYFELAVDQTAEGFEESDFLWAKAEGVSQSDGTVNLHMKHMMSKLVVKIVAGEEYVGSLPEDASVFLLSTVTGARVNLETGSIVKDPNRGVKSIKMRNVGRRVDNGIEAIVYEAVVLPQMLDTKVPFLEINSKSVSYILEEAFSFRPGVAYTYTATLNTSTNAIKVEIGCEIEDWNNIGGDSGEEGGDGSEGDDGEDDTDEYTDLSIAGTANCYLIQRAGDYKFKAVMGNVDASVGNVKKVEVLWESFGTDEQPCVGDLISSALYKDGYVCFSTPENFRNGNAVIAAKNSKGTILWSWHIWCAEEGWNEHVYYNDAGTMMDRNLGATSATPGNVGALGLIYQWGRKDPFLGAAGIYTGLVASSTGTWSTLSYTETIDDQEANPMTYYTSRARYDWQSEKTVYDPCPAGWRVPDGGEDGVWAKAYRQTSTNGVWADHGINCSGIFGDAEMIWYPNTGQLQSRVTNLVSIDNGYCWSCTSSTSFCLRTCYNEVLPQYGTMGINCAIPVRCQKDE